MSSNALFKSGAYLKFKRQQQDSNPQPCSSKTKAQSFSQTSQMIDCAVSTYLHLILCYYNVMYKFQSESTPYGLSECKRTPFSKQAPYLKFK